METQPDPENGYLSESLNAHPTPAGEESWRALEARMDKRRRRRLLFWLWPLGLGLAAGLGVAVWHAPSPEGVLAGQPSQTVESADGKPGAPMAARSAERVVASEAPAAREANARPDLAATSEKQPGNAIEPASEKVEMPARGEALKGHNAGRSEAFAASRRKGRPIEQAGVGRRQKRAAHRMAGRAEQPVQGNDRIGRAGDSRLMAPGRAQAGSKEIASASDGNKDSPTVPTEVEGGDTQVVVADSTHREDTAYTVAHERAAMLTVVCQEADSCRPRPKAPRVRLDVGLAATQLWLAAGASPTLAEGSRSYRSAARLGPALGGEAQAGLAVRLAGPLWVRPMVSFALMHQQVELAPTPGPASLYTLEVSADGSQVTGRPVPPPGEERATRWLPLAAAGAELCLDAALRLQLGAGAAYMHVLGAGPQVSVPVWQASARYGWGSWLVLAQVRYLNLTQGALPGLPNSSGEGVALSLGLGWRW